MAAIQGVAEDGAAGSSRPSTTVMMMMMISGYLTWPWKMAHLWMMFPLKPPFIRDFSMAMLNNKMVYIIVI